MPETVTLPRGSGTVKVIAATNMRSIVQDGHGRPRGYHVVAMWPPSGGHVATTWPPRGRHVAATLII